MRIHKSKNLHAKFYLCLPQNFSPNTDGWVLMGSSNISDSGLGITQPPQYELNVAMKDYDDVAYCKNEFETLWNEGIPIIAFEHPATGEHIMCADGLPADLLAILEGLGKRCRGRHRDLSLGGADPCRAPREPNT